MSGTRQKQETRQEAGNQEEVAEVRQRGKGGAPSEVQGRVDDLPEPPAENPCREQLPGAAGATGEAPGQAEGQPRSQEADGKEDEITEQHAEVVGVSAAENPGGVCERDHQKRKKQGGWREEPRCLLQCSGAHR